MLHGTAAAAAGMAEAPAPAPALGLAPEAAEDGARFPALGLMELYLEVVVNGMPRGLNLFGARDGELWASAGTLQRLGIAPGADAGNIVRLATLGGVRAAYDAAQQRLTIDASLSALRLPTTVLDAPGVAGQPSNGSSGALLNYDLYALQGSYRTSTLSAWSETRVFHAAGLFSSTGWTRLARRGDGRWGAESTRLDTTWSTSFPDRMLTLRLGDTVSGAQGWTRATRFAGLQLATDFALQPYRVTLPTPTFAGSATLPSEVELIVNGMRQYTGSVPAGPFQLSALPSVNGAGTAQVIVTDLNGRSTTLSFSLYAAHQLLAQGLTQASAELGFVRENYGLASFDYGRRAVASGTWRHGLSDRFTFEAHAEATRGLVGAGVGGAWLLGTAGVVSGSAAQSFDGSRSGTQLGLGYSWRDDRFHVALDGTRAQGRYMDVAARYGAAPSLAKAAATTGYDTRAFGTVGLSYALLSDPGQPTARFAGASWSMAIGHATSMNLTLSQDLVHRDARSAFFGVTIALGGGAALSAGLERDDGTRFSLDAHRPTSSDGGIGWHAGLRRGAQGDGALAEVEYIGSRGRIAAGVTTQGSQGYAYENVSGALVLMGGSVFAVRKIDDAFAVVSTDGIADVPVTIENRRIGTTGADGMLLVTSLRAYQNNLVGIDGLKLPADMRIDRVSAIATPRDRAGVLVRFGIQPIRAASVTLVDERGRPLPLGSRVRLQGRAGEDDARVGFDGVVYLEGLEARNALAVQTPAGRCRASFEYSKPLEGIGQIGPLTCREDRP